MNANTIISDSASTPVLPELVMPDNIRNWSLATLTSESKRKYPFSFVAVTPKILASFTSCTNSLNVVNLTATFDATHVLLIATLAPVENT